jgi:hypothetical protein
MGGMGVSTTTGLRGTGISERDCAHPATARPSIPTAIVRLMLDMISILGELAPRDRSLAENQAETGRPGRIISARTPEFPDLGP